MSFFRSLVVLTAVCLCIAFSYFFGHALAVHSTRPMVYGAALLLAGAALIVLLARRDQERRRQTGARTPW